MALIKIYHHRIAKWLYCIYLLSRHHCFFFYHNLYLIDVLYIRDLSSNLISVPKLTQTISCHLIFYNTKCLIHDNYKRIMIVEAIMNYGLYIMDTPTISTLYTPIVTSYDKVD